MHVYLIDIEAELKDLVCVLSGVYWYKLGIQLNVPSNVLKRIEREYPHDELRMLTKMLEYWKENEEDPTWENIAKALQRIGGHRNIVIEIRSKYMNSADEVHMANEVTTPISLEENLSKVPSQLLDSPITDANIIGLSRCIFHWRDLSPYLSLTPEEESRIVTSFPATSTSRQCIDMLRTWKEKWATNATYR